MDLTDLHHHHTQARYHSLSTGLDRITGLVRIATHRQDITVSVLDWSGSSDTDRTSQPQYWTGQDHHTQTGHHSLSTGLDRITTHRQDITASVLDWSGSSHTGRILQPQYLSDYAHQATYSIGGGWLVDTCSW